MPRGTTSGRGKVSYITDADYLVILAVVLVVLAIGSAVWLHLRR
jgi:hypothetical protein